MVVLGVPSGSIEPHRAHTGSRSFTPRVAAVITASGRTCRRMTSLQINCPSMSFGVNIVSLGRKLMIGKRQKCAEPPGGGGSLGLYTTPQLSGGGGDFWVCAQ